MSLRFDAETLYNLIPTVYRLRDAEVAQDPAKGGPLRQLVEVLAEQGLVVEEGIYQLYDDQFIETCAEWVVPYIGDLIGARLIKMPDDDQDDIRFSQRAQVANTIATRRRKGTSAILEQVARDVTNFQARVVEFFKLVATTQHMNHIRIDHRVTPNLRDTSALENLDSPFTTIPRTLDVRRIQSGRGKYNLPNIGIFLWRTQVYPISDVPPFAIDERRFLFNPMGFNSQLFNRPEPEERITSLAQAIHTPHPISRLQLRLQLTTYYGRAFTLYRDNMPVAASDIQVCNLSDSADDTWAHAPEDKIGIDPVLGRIHFPINSPAPNPNSITVSYHMPYVREMGAGEYDRDLDIPQGASVTDVNILPELESGIDSMRIVNTGETASEQTGVVAITNSHAYDYDPTSPVFVGSGNTLIVGSRDGNRPVLNLQSSWRLQGTDDSRVVLDGLRMMGNPIIIQGKMSELIIRHCTLVPGVSLAIDGTPQQPEQAMLILQPTVPCAVTIRDSIIGGIRAAPNVNVSLESSIIDSTADNHIAYAAPDATPTNRKVGGALTMQNCTVRGTIHTSEIPEISNSIIKASGTAEEPGVLSQRQQYGCVRFSYHPRYVQMPRRYHCVPSNLDLDSIDHPIFVTERYGATGYFQLRPNTPASIRHGADDDEEMGAYHDVYQHLRERNLRYRMAEYLRFSLQAGVFYVS